jgi:hypothetical protein
MGYTNDLTMLLSLLPKGRGPGVAAGTHIGNTLSTHIGNR